MLDIPNDIVEHLFYDNFFIIQSQINIHLINYLKFKKGILHPDRAIKYLFNKDFAKIDLAKKNIENYFDNYKSIRDYNKKNSKYSLYFDFCKRDVGKGFYWNFINIWKG